MCKSKTLSPWQKLLGLVGLGEKKCRGGCSRNRRNFQFEPLEERQLLSVCHWGGAINGNWSEAGNWWVGNQDNHQVPVANDVLVFDGTSNTSTTNNLPSGTSFQSIQFASSGFTLSGSPITLTDGITVDTGVSGSTIALSGVTLGGAIDVDMADSQSLTISSSLSGNGSLTTSGSGALVLSGTNTYTGSTTVGGGTVTLGNNSAIGSSNHGIVVTNGATLDINGNVVTAGAVALVNGTIAGPTSTLIASSYTVSSGTITANLQGSGTPLTKISDGEVTLSGANTYSGLTTVDSGRLVLKGESLSTPKAWNPVLNLGGADIRDGQLVFDYYGGSTPASTVRSDLIASYPHSNPQQTRFAYGQIYSSTATGDYTLGWTDNTANSRVVVQRTIIGDVNLSTAVDSTDEDIVRANLGTSNASWSNGDVNYSGTVTSSDLILLRNRLNLSATGRAPEAVGIYRLDTNPTNANELQFLVLFSEDVTGVEAGDFNVIRDLAHSQNAATVTSIVGIGPNTNKATYIVTVSSVYGNGTLALTLSDQNTTITGADGTLTGSGASGQTAFTGETYTTASPFIWEGDGANTDWTTGANWAGEYAPVEGDCLVFAGTNTSNYNNYTNTTFQSIEFASSGFTLSGSAITLTDGITVDAGVSGSTVDLSGVVLGGSVDVDVAGDQTLTISSSLSGTGSLHKSNSGSLVLSGSSNTYSDGTYVAEGTLKAMTTSALPSAGASGTVSVSTGATLAVKTDASGVSGWTESQINSLLGNSTFTTGNIGFDVTGAGSFTYSQSIGGSHGLVKLGTGTLTLTGNNTYSGETSISVGTLQLGYYTTTGTLGLGAVKNNGALVLAHSNDVVIGNTISGTGSVTQQVFGGGGGILIPIGWVPPVAILTGDNTYSGGTTINAYTALQVGNGGTTGTLGTEGVGGAGNLSFNRSGVFTASNAISGSLSVTQKGSGTLILTGSSTYTGDTKISGGELLVGNPNALSYSTLDYSSYGGTLSFGEHTAVTLGGLKGNQSLALTNANSQNVDLTVGGNGVATTYSGILSGDGSLTKAGAGTLTLSGNNSYTGGTTLGAGTLSLGGANAIGTSGTITFSGGTLQSTWYNTTDYSDRFSPAANQAYNIDTGGYLVTLTNALTSSGGTLTKLGSGTLTLTGDNTYTGGTTISAGILSFGNGGLGSSGSITFAGNSTLQWNGSNTQDVSSRLAINNGVSATLDVGSGYTVILATGFGGGGTGSVTKTGYGTLILAGDNTYTGTTTVNYGTLQLEAGGPTGGIAGNVSGYSGTLTFNYGDAITFGNTISGSLSLVQQGTGVLTLSGNNTSWYGTTTINEGKTLRAGSSTATGNGVVTVNGTFDLNGYSPAVGGLSGGGRVTLGVVGTKTLTINGSGNNTFSGVIENGSGTVVLAQAGGGTTNLTGNSTYTGGTTISAGVLSFGNGGLGSSGAITFAGNSTLQWNGSNTQDVSSRLAINNGVSATLDVGSGYTVTLATGFGGGGTGSVTKTGYGTLILAGDNTYTGTTTVNYGTLSLQRTGGDTLATAGALTINSSGTLDLGGNTQHVSGGAVHILGGTVQNGTLSKSGSDYDGQAGTVTATLAGTAGLTKTGSGTLTLEGANTKRYTGETMVNAGYLNIKDGFDLTYTGKITINDYGLLQFTGTQDLTGTGEILLQTDYHYYSSYYGGICVGSLGESSSTTLTVGSNVLIHGFGIIARHCSNDSLYNEGTIQADVADKELAFGLPGSELSWTNAGTIAAVGAGILAKDGTVWGYHHDYETPWEGYLWGDCSVLGTEVAISWDGFTGGQWMYSVQVSLDADDNGVPDEYFTVATRDGGDDDAPSTFMISGLASGESYYFRIVATDGAATEIYGAGKVTTLNVFDENVPDDSSGWYRVGNITASGTYESGTRTYQLDTDWYPITITDEVPWGTPLIPTTSEHWKPYVESAELNSERPAWLTNATVMVSGAAGMLPSGSDHVFTLDTSWINAGSPETAVMQALQGLVADGSVPTVVDGVATVYHVRLYTYPSYPVTQDFWTFDLGRCTFGGYSDVWRYDPYSIPVTPAVPPCTDPCGCGGNGGIGGGSPPQTAGSSAASGGSKTSTNNMASTGGCSPCGTAPGGLTYSSRAYEDSGFGSGWSDADEFPTLLGGSQNFAVRFGAEASVWFDENSGNYTARYGAKQTLVHDTENGLYIYTDTDGTRCEFYDADANPGAPAHPRYGLFRVVAPSGATIEVPSDIQENGWSYDGKIVKVLYKTTEGGDPYQLREFTYWNGASAVGRRGHVHTITLSEYDGTNWTNVRQLTYDYYGDSASFGATGDLKTVVTQQWNGSSWTGDDTYYYRYYTGQYDAETNPGYAHSLRRVLLPNAYAAALSNFGVGNLDTVTETQVTNGKTIADYTCFYYEYDADRRVSKEAIFGQSNETEFTNTLSGNSDGYNTWHRKSVETLLNNSNGSIKSTNTVYTNYLGQTLLIDLYDAAAGTHTITYNRYDDDGRLVLTAEPSAIDTTVVSSNDEHGYDSDQADLGVSFTANGLVYETVYYASTDSAIDGDTAGGAEGYVAYQLSRLSDNNADQVFETVSDVTSWLSSPDPDTALLRHQDYFARWTNEAVNYEAAVAAGHSIIYVVANYTTYEDADGNGAITTEYAYAWYSGSFQIEERTTTLPEVSSGQNGSGISAERVEHYNNQGRLVWAEDENGHFTFYSYDNLTGRPSATVQPKDGIGTAAGTLNYGVAAQDAATGTGFIMYSAENVFERFDANPPPSGNSEHFIVVKYDIDHWCYDDDTAYRTFTPCATDVLIAEVNFDADTITSLEGISAVEHDIAKGFLAGDLTFTADWWNGQADDGEFTVDGAHFVYDSALVTNYTYDALGRVTRTLGPAHIADINGDAHEIRTATWTFYNDANHETRTAQGYILVSDSSEHIVGPVSIAITDRDGRITERIQVPYGGTLAQLAATAFSQTYYTAWTTYQYSKTRLVSTRVYHNIPTGGAGDPGDDYLQTTYDYEDFGDATRMGRQNKTIAADGTITRVVLDARGNVIETWMGTNDDAAIDADPSNTDPLTGLRSDPDNNMVKVSSSSYDISNNLTESRSFWGTGSNDCYLTTYLYDWRNQLTDVRTPANVVTHYEYDNLGRVKETETYADTNQNYFTYDNGVIIGTNVESSERRALSKTSYDVRGRVYETRTYEVDQQYGTVGDYLATYTWYDPAGHVIKTQTGDAGAFQKYQYDGLGRVIGKYSGFDRGGETTADLYDEDGKVTIDLDDDTIVEQTENYYDEAGQTVATISYQRLPDDRPDTGTEGELSATTSYATGAVYWYDGIGRTTATANFGHETTSDSVHYLFDASGTLRDSDSDGVPNVAEEDAPTPYNTTEYPDSRAGLDFQLSLTKYDSAGRVWETIDNLGRCNATFYDDAGRVVEAIQNYLDGDSATAASTTFTADQDIIVNYEYDSYGRLATQTAVNAVGYNLDVGQAPTCLVTGVSSADTYLMYSVEDVGTRFGGTANDQHVLVVRYNGSAWEYDTGTTFASLTTRSTDVLLATVDMSGTTPVISGIAVQAVVHDVQSGYAASELAFDFISGSPSHFTVSGYFSLVTDQVTKYLYDDSATSINHSWQTGVVYPDSTDSVVPSTIVDGAWAISSGTDHTATSYDQLGRKATATDQRGVVHSYDYDSAGRLSADTVTNLGDSGQNVDGAVRLIGTAYDHMGRVHTVTSYSDTAGTSVVNQVQYAYDSWGNLAQEWQAHDGEVNTNSTMSVQYSYDDGYSTSGSDRPVNYVRLDQVTYPNGRHVGYDYNYGPNAAIDDLMSRLSAIYDDADGTETVRATYKYLGRSQIVEEDYVDAETKLTYLDGSGNVTGLDRFGRVVDQVWEDYSGTPTPIDEYAYGYDRSGNRLWKQNLEQNADGLDERYEYDALNRLTNTKRGTLDFFDPDDPTITSQTKYQDWTLDGLGNFSTFDDNNDSQDRTVDAANQIQSISGGSVTPVYDNAGNMISGPSPDSPTTRVHYKYDAWNRLVGVYTDDSGEPDDVIATYEYDGANRRIEKIVAGESSDTTTDFYYNQQWQMLETVTDDGEDVTWDQYVYSPRYIDSPIVRFHDGDLDGDCTLGASSPDSIRYYLNDANYNVTTTITTDASGKSTEHVVYDAYGKATACEADWDVIGAPSDSGPLYCGYFFDAETGLYQVRNRYYDASLSTWISRDPIGYRGGINLYEYVGDNPLTRTDQTGLVQTGGMTDGNSNTVVCDGNDGFEIRLPFADKAPKGVAAVNDIIECVRKHEQRHIDDLKKFAPDVCKEKAKGTKIEYYNNAERLWYEGAAIGVELACLREIKCKYRNDASSIDEITYRQGRLVDYYLDLWDPRRNTGA